jgi:hypothetical protein
MVMEAWGVQLAWDGGKMRYGDMVIERSLFRQGYNRTNLILRTGKLSSD